MEKIKKALKLVISCILISSAIFVPSLEAVEERCLRAPVLFSADIGKERAVRVSEKVKDEKHHRRGRIREERLDEINSLVPQLVNQFGRRPNVSEVAGKMNTLFGSTNAKKVLAFLAWMKKSGYKAEDFGIQKFSHNTDEPIEASFRFAGVRIHIPQELSKKIKVMPTTDVRSKLNELILQSIEKPWEKLYLSKANDKLYVRYKNRRNTINMSEKTGTTIQLHTLSSVICFSDAINGIPVEFGLARKIALVNSLEAQKATFRGSKNKRKAADSNISIGGDVFFLPSYYRSHGDRIITYSNGRVCVLMDSENHENSFVLEKRNEGYYSSESGEKIKPSGRINDKRRNKFNKLFDLSKIMDFKIFDEGLDKTEHEAYVIDKDTYKIVCLGIVQIRVGFWTDESITVESVETQRAYKTRDDKRRYPLILKITDKQRNIIINYCEGSENKITVSGLCFKDGRQVILKGPYINLSVIMEMIRYGLFKDIIADPLLLETFKYRKRMIPPFGRYNPIRTYKIDAINGEIEAGDLIDPSTLYNTNVETGKIPKSFADYTTPVSLRQAI